MSTANISRNLQKTMADTTETVYEHCWMLPIDLTHSFYAEYQDL